MKCPQCGSHDLERVTATNWLCLRCGGIAREEQPTLTDEEAEAIRPIQPPHPIQSVEVDVGVIDILLVPDTPIAWRLRGWRGAARET